MFDRYKSCGDAATADALARTIAQAYASQYGRPYPIPPAQLGGGLQPTPAASYYHVYYVKPVANLVPATPLSVRYGGVAMSGHVDAANLSAPDKGVVGTRPMWRWQKVIIAGQSNAQIVSEYATPPPYTPFDVPLVKVWQSGSSLRVHWPPGSALRNALAAELADVNQPCAVYWNQGESDIDSTSAEYESMFDSFFSDVHANRANVIWAMTLLPAASILAGTTTVRPAQERIVAKYSNIRAINADSYVLSDTVHYNEHERVQSWADALEIFWKAA